MNATNVARAFITTLLFLATSLAAEELSVDQLIEKSLAARGGREKWEAIHSLKVTGRFSTFSQDAPFSLWRARPNRYRFEYKYSGMDITAGYDGVTPWWINSTFFTPESWTVEVPITDAKEIKSDAEFGGPLYDYQRRGHQVVFVGLKDLDGEQTYEIDVTLADGPSERWYLDAESLLPVARFGKGSDLQNEVDRWTYYSDFAEFGGMLFPRLVEIDLSGRYMSMKVEAIEINPELDESLFAFKIPAGMEKLQKLAGEWDVQVVGQRPIPAMPFMKGEFSSSIESELHGSLLEESFSFLAFGSPRNVRQWITYDQFHQAFRLIHFDDMTFHASVLEGTFEEDGRLVLTNVKSGTSWSSKGMEFFSRMVYHDFSDDGFKVDWDVSPDAGATWSNGLQFVYQRRVAESSE